MHVIKDFLVHHLELASLFEVFDLFAYFPFASEFKEDKNNSSKQEDAKDDESNLLQSVGPVGWLSLIF